MIFRGSFCSSVRFFVIIFEPSVKFAQYFVKSYDEFIAKAKMLIYSFFQIKSSFAMFASVYMLCYPSLKLLNYSKTWVCEPLTLSIQLKFHKEFHIDPLLYLNIFPKVHRCKVYYILYIIPDFCLVLFVMLCFTGIQMFLEFFCKVWFS